MAGVISVGPVFMNFHPEAHRIPFAFGWCVFGWRGRQEPVFCTKSENHTNSCRFQGIPPRGQKPNKLREKIAQINSSLEELLPKLENVQFSPIDPSLYIQPNGEEKPSRVLGVSAKLVRTSLGERLVEEKLHLAEFSKMYPQRLSSLLACSS